MRLFIENVLLLGFWNIVLIGFVLLLIHQGLAQTLTIVEKLNDMKVQVYWYDVSINIVFILVFIYSIYSYR